MRSTPSPSPSSDDLVACWRALLECPWSSLALVPADERTSLDGLLAALRSSTEGARRPATLVDARGLDPGEGKIIATRLQSRAGERLVLAIDSPLTSLAGVHVVSASEVSLLVVVPGDGAHASVTATSGLVGSDRILGTVAIPAGS